MIEEINLEHNISPDAPEPLPFPFNQRTFCRYEPIEKRIEEARVLVINSLLRHEERHLGGGAPRVGTQRRVRASARAQNLGAGGRKDSEQYRAARQAPETRVAHLSELTEAARDFQPDAIVLSGTLRDFDYYNPAHLEEFGALYSLDSYSCAGHLRRPSTGRLRLRRARHDAR